MNATTQNRINEIVDEWRHDIWKDTGEEPTDAELAEELFTAAHEDSEDEDPQLVRDWIATANYLTSKA